MLDPNPQSKSVLDPSALLLAARAEDAPLLLGRMARWRWVMGAREVAFAREMCALFDFDTTSFIPTLANLRNLVSVRDMSRLFITVNRLIQDGREGAVDFTLRHPLRDAVEYHVRCYLCCERDANTNDVSVLYGLLQDVTTEKRNRAALQHALDEAEAANRAKSRFLATMSHELRTPLNAIIGFSEMMHAELLGPLGNKRYVDYAASINESGRYLLDLINDILDMSKIEAGKYELVHEPINVVKAIRLSCHMVENTIRDKGLTLTLKNSNETPVIEADRRAFMQVILNILSNAVKFTESGGTVTINVTDAPDNRIMIEVSDTGIGIPAEKLGRIGQPFEQVSGAMARTHGGTGLGLAITKKLVEMHDGELRIASVYGQGTTVTILMPAIGNQRQYDLFNGQKRQPTQNFDDAL